MCYLAIFSGYVLTKTLLSLSTTPSTSTVVTVSMLVAISVIFVIVSKPELPGITMSRVGDPSVPSNVIGNVPAPSVAELISLKVGVVTESIMVSMSSQTKSKKQKLWNAVIYKSVQFLLNLVCINPIYTLHKNMIINKIAITIIPDGVVVGRTVVGNTVEAVVGFVVNAK